MKRIISVLSLLLVLVPGVAEAAPITRDVAAEYAGNFMESDNVQLAFTSLEIATKSSSGASFYAFNRPSGGWVIIAADDCAVPVLAHSDEGSLSPDNIPSNMKNYLGTVTANIAKVSASNLESDRAVRNLWATKGVQPRTKAGDSQVVLNTALWGQGDPYNKTICSKVKSGGYTVSGLYTGCVATAMAITLRCLGYPASPTGTVPSYKTDTKNYTVPEVDLDSYGNYDWDNMPTEYDGNWTAAQKNAVADLMFHCGAMVSMDYTKSGSGAYSEDIPAALSTYMGFSPALADYYRENYSNYEWLNMLKAEIDAGVPVIYGGSDITVSEGGHQFIVDGYNSGNEVHVNWGWSGSCNGWYAVCYVGDVDNVEGVFNYYDSAILGLRKASVSGSACPHIYMLSNGDDPGLSLEGSIARNESFRLSAYVYNGDGENAYVGSSIAALVSADGSIKEQISSEYTLSVSKSSGGYYGYGTMSCSCKITEEIKPGDFVAVYYKNGYGEWARLGGADHVVVEKSSERYYTVSRISAVPSISYIYSPSNLKAGDIFYCDLVTDGRCPTSVAWSFDNASLSNPFTTLSSGKHVVKAIVKYYDGSSQTIIRNITVQ